MIDLRTRTKTVLTWLVVAGILTGTIVGIWVFLVPRSVLDLGNGQTSVRFIDGVTSVEYTTTDFNGVLYEADELDNFADFDIVKTYNAGIDVDDNDIKDVEKTYLILYVEQTTLEHDEDLFDEDIGSRVFLVRWVIIISAMENIIQVYQKPSYAGVICVNQETFVNIAVKTAFVTARTNVTVLIAVNQSESDSMYIRQKDYENEVDLVISLRVEFNKTVALSAFSLNGMAKDRYNTTALMFDIPDVLSLGDGMIRIYQGIWGDDIDAGEIKITKMTLLYGETSLCII